MHRKVKYVCVCPAINLKLRELLNCHSGPRPYICMHMSRYRFEVKKLLDCHCGPKKLKKYYVYMYIPLTNLELKRFQNYRRGPKFQNIIYVYICPVS